MNLSFREYLKLEEADPKKKKDVPDFQDMASKILGVDPKDRIGQVYVGSDVQDGKDGWNVVPMVVGTPTFDKYGKITGNKMELKTKLRGQRMMRRYEKQGDKWIDKGRENTPNKKTWLPADVISQWINQGAENGAQGGGAVPGM